MVIIYKTLKGYPCVYNILKRLLYIDNYYYIYYNIILIYYISIIIHYIYMLFIYIDILLFLYIIIYNIHMLLTSYYNICYIMYVTYKSYSKGECI